MKSFDYKIKDKLGIHARPAGLLVKFVSQYKSQTTIKLGEKSADAKRLFAVMGLGAKYEDTINVTVSGEDEDLAVNQIQKFCQENF